MKGRKKSYGLIITFIVFVFSFLMANNGESDSNIRYDLTLKNKAALSFINANNNVNSFSEDDKTSRTNFASVITETRISTSSDNDLFDITDGGFCIKKFSQALYSYIQNYSLNRVLHPLLSQLGSWLI